MLKGLMPKGSFWLMVNLFLDCTQVEKKDSTTTGKVLSVYLLMGMILCKDPCKKFWLQPCSLSLAKGVFFFFKMFKFANATFLLAKIRCYESSSSNTNNCYCLYPFGYLWYFWRKFREGSPKDCANGIQCIFDCDFPAILVIIRTIWLIKNFAMLPADICKAMMK